MYEYDQIYDLKLCSFPQSVLLNMLSELLRFIVDGLVSSILAAIGRLVLVAKSLRTLENC